MADPTPQVDEGLSATLFTLLHSANDAKEQLSQYLAAKKQAEEATQALYKASDELKKHKQDTLNEINKAKGELAAQERAALDAQEENAKRIQVNNDQIKHLADAQTASAKRESDMLKRERDVSQALKDAERHHAEAKRQLDEALKIRSEYDAKVERLKKAIG